MIRPARRRGGDSMRGGIDRAVDRLRHPEPRVREAGARGCGAAGLEVAIPLLRDRMADPDRRVRAAAAAALGRIGGARAADTLMRALRTQRLPPERLARELARAAPDFYLETALERPENRSFRAAIAMAAGLRRRPATMAAALTVLLEGDEAERAAACHALGAMGHAPAIPLLIDALFDRSPPVRQAAGRALTRLGVREPVWKARGGAFSRQVPAPRRGLLARLGGRLGGRDWRWRR